MREYLYVFLGVILVLLSAAPALGETYTFTGNVNCGWNVNGNWDKPGYPDADDTAIIPAGKTVCVGPDESPGNSDCGTLDVANSTAAVDIYHEGTQLKIWTAADIDGEIRFKGSIIEFGPFLTVVGDNVQFTGSGLIRADTASGLTPGNISGAADNVLTLGQYLTVKGSITISAEMVNNGLVLVDDEDDVITLTGNTKGGGTSGKWKCTAGALNVYACTVTGAAKWILKGDPDTSELRFWSNAIAESLSGNFDISGGTFRIDTTLCTAGDITVKAGANNPKVYVNSNQVATFNGACP